MMMDDFGGPLPKNEVHWVETETVDAAEVRMLVNTYIHNIINVFRDEHKIAYTSNLNKLRLYGFPPNGAKNLSHDIVDFLITDNGPPFSVRKQAMDNAIDTLLFTIQKTPSVFLVNNPESPVDINILCTYIDKIYTNNIEIFEYIEARVQVHTQSDRPAHKAKM